MKGNSRGDYEQHIKPYKFTRTNIIFRRKSCPEKEVGHYLKNTARNGRMQQQYFGMNKFEKTGYINEK